MKLYEFDVDVVNAFLCKGDEYIVLECVIRDKDNAHVCKIIEKNNAFFSKVADGDVTKFKGTFALIKYEWRLVSYKGE